jgi:AraC-like DNA-binding protein
MNSNGKNLVDALTNSKVYLDYARAFNEITGLPLTLRPVESWKLPYHGRRNENGYCALMARKSSACASCLQTQQRLSECATHEAQSLTCVSGLTESAVPVRLGEHLIGFLQTGQVFRKKPTPAQFERVARHVRSWGLEVDHEQLRRAYFQTRVLSPREHDSIVKMLGIFSQHLAMVSNQVLVRQEHPEPPMITRAKEYIQEHQSEDLSLGQVARAVNTSTFYFCKVFRKATGINFTDYVSRVRIEKAKNLALNPNLRISEIAFEVGFQSLTHFNRVFKKITGLSPTEYRAQLPA